MAASVHTTHAMYRAMERVPGVVPDKKWFAEVVTLILAGKAKRVRFLNGPNEKPVYDVDTASGHARVVFDPVDKCIVTVLPDKLPVEQARDKIKRLSKQSAQRKKAFFRGFEDGDE